MDMEGGPGQSLDHLVKLDLKVLARETTAADPEEFIPVFHRWITERALPELLIDVADYSHVHEGPGVLLVGHDAIYAWDLSRGEPGLLYSRRRETSAELEGIDTLERRLESLLACAFRACNLIEAEPRLEGRVSFDRRRLELRVNDRLVPRGDDTAAVLEHALARSLAAIGGEPGSGAERKGAPVTVARIGEDRERLTLRTR